MKSFIKSSNLIEENPYTRLTESLLESVNSNSYSPSITEITKKDLADILCSFALSSLLKPIKLLEEIKS